MFDCSQIRRSSAWGFSFGLFLVVNSLTAQEPTLEQVKTAGASKSKYLAATSHPASTDAPKADLKGFQKEIAPILANSCVECHGPDKQKGKFRVDTLDPDLLRGEDIDWWLEVMDVLSNEEMPPPDEDVEIAEEDRSKIIDWLSGQILVASQVEREEGGHSSFRRMTRYEYNYALQDLLGLELNFSKDLPPDPVSEDGFRNSSETLKITASQYSRYLELNRAALKRATVRGERPEQLSWGVSAERAATRRAKSRKELDAEIEKEAEAQAQKAPERKGGNRRGRGGRGSHHLNTKTGQTKAATWAFRRAVHAWAPTTTRPEVPGPSDYTTVLPVGDDYVVELGNRLPDEGILRVRVRATRVSAEADLIPSLALDFGWQGHNNSKATFEISKADVEIDAPPGKPKFYHWDIPLSEIYPRNPVRKTVKLGAAKLTNPSEYIRLRNTSLSKSADLHVDYVEVLAPVFEQWPPASHTGIFIDSENKGDERVYAREIVSHFMTRAWRRKITDAEVDGKMAYFLKVRPVCDDFQQAVIEVLATVLSSPRFLYLVQSDRPENEGNRALDDFELATRLSMFLWCSTPDEELLDLAAEGRLGKPDELARQTRRMLADPRHERFSEHFVRQWLDMDLLDFLKIDRSTYPEFDDALKDAMQQEPIAFFEEALQKNHSVMDFVHADYALVNERLAQHYGISGVRGQGFQKVSVTSNGNRGGLLTMAGLLAMNSDGKDSNPLKRGIWMLESILNDPPPPPPPAVPEIDLADPEILKMSLKERMEDHRNKPACFSCHQKIDPWGIALENYDAIGAWRTQHRGREIDAGSLLFNQQELNGADGLKRYLLSNRQDQFVRAIVHKMTTFALGRPLTFADHANIDRLTAELRKEGDGLTTLITLIVTSDLFQSR